MCRALHTIPDVSRLILWSHWITPVQERKRFDTKFFLALVKPEDASLARVSADGLETLHIDWLTPSQALEMYHKGEIALFPPQYCTLTDLASLKYADLEDYVLGRLRMPKIVPFCPLHDSSNACSYLPGDDKLPETKGSGLVNRIMFSTNEDGSLRFVWKRSAECVLFKARL